MSWIVKFQKEVESCEDCPIYQEIPLPLYGAEKRCGYDKTEGAFKAGRGWFLPSDIRPCPLKVGGTYCAHCKHSRYYDDFLCTKGLQRKSEADVCEGYEEE
jgi:hypothetical protein